MSNVGLHLLSGALSGFASTICLQPLDLLKTRLQQGDHAVEKRSTIFRTARDVITSEGPFGLWRGTTATLVRNVPGIAVYMTGLNSVRTVMARFPYFAAASSRSRTSEQHGSALPLLTSQGNLVAGATTRVAVGFLLNPLSVLKARFESSMHKYDSFHAAVRSIFRAGPSELLRGFTASALRDAPYAGLFVVFYEGLKRKTVTLSTSTSNSSIVHGFSAASAGALATIATHPFDVIKTKVQVRSEERYTGLLRTVRTIWIQRGTAGFFDGLSLRMSRKVLSSAISWTIYEAILMLTASHKEKQH